MSPPEMEHIARRICRDNGLSEPKFIGKGAFKETYLIQSSDGHMIALKVINSRKQNPSRTEREINALKRCRCESICKFFDHGVFIGKNGEHYEFSFEEFLGGGTLTDRLQKGNLSTKIVHSYAFHLSIAINHLDELGLVHRDIKPDNIMFRTNSDVPVLVDLGLVRDLSRSSLTQSWAALGPGTPFFSSPEQLNNEKRLITWKSDQFSLGVVLSLCVLGRHPYDPGGLGPEHVIDQVANRKPLSKDFVAQIAEIGLEPIPRMVQPWPIQRYQYSLQLIEAFRTL